MKADFENFKKRSDKQNADRVQRAAETLVTQLLPVLDASEAAINHGATEVEPIFKSLLDILEREGLERDDPVGQPFDPDRPRGRDARGGRRRRGRRRRQPAHRLLVEGPGHPPGHGQGQGLTGAGPAGDDANGPTDNAPEAERR